MLLLLPTLCKKLQLLVKLSCDVTHRLPTIMVIIESVRYRVVSPVGFLACFAQVAVKWGLFFQMMLISGTLGPHHGNHVPLHCIFFFDFD